MIHGAYRDAGGSLGWGEWGGVGVEIICLIGWRCLPTERKCLPENKTFL